MILSQIKRIISGNVTRFILRMPHNSGENIGIPLRSFSGITSNFISDKTSNHPWLLQASPPHHSLKSGMQIPTAVIDPVGILSRIPMIRRPTVDKEYKNPGGLSHQILEDPLLHWKPSIEEAPSVNSSLEKRAARLIVIRRSKMNKHKLRKLRKKMKYVWAKVKQRREMRKEKAYLNSKMEMIQAARQFDPKAFVASVIRKAKEEPEPERWQDPLMPQWYKDQLVFNKIKGRRYEKLLNLHLNKPIRVPNPPIVIPPKEKKSNKK